MFSIENLAWRTSNSARGFSTNDLALCERGPNGGRVMWFPPYGLTFTESVSANWNANEFLGRPEPIYTYKNTSRTGTLTWKIVVDHPSAFLLSVLAGWTTKVSWVSVVMATSFSVLVGIVFGLRPAMQAAGLNPVEALRYE